MRVPFVRVGLAILLIGLFWTVPRTYGQDLSHGVVVVERSLGCFGVCADYDIEIHADGRVIWNGHANVNAKGIKKTRVDRAVISRLFEEFFSHGTEREICMDGGGIDGPLYWVLFSRAGDAEKLRAQSIELFGLLNTSPEEVHFPCTIGHKFDEVITSLEQAVDSHQWMHGRESILDGHKVSEDIQIGTKPGLTPLMRAAGSTGHDDNERAVRLAQNQSVNAADQTGWTALMFAAVRCNQPTIEILLLAGANPNAQDNNGDTALTAAATADCWVTSDEPITRYALMKRLIEAGASINHMNRNGATALMIAAQFGNPESMRALLESGARPNLRDRRGDDARDYAMKLARWLRLQPQSRREEYGKRLQDVLAVLSAKR